MVTSAYPASYTVVHSISGRLRVRIPYLTYNRDSAYFLQKQVADISGVRSTRVNGYARSLIIEYDSSILSGDKLLQHLEETIDEALVCQKPTASNKGTPERQKNIRNDILADPWQRLALPSFGLTLAILATSLELTVPTLLLGSVTFAATMPLFIRSGKDLARGRFDEEILELLWTVFSGLSGDFIAPNLDMVLTETSDLLHEATSQVPPSPQTTHLPIVEQVRVMLDGKESKISIDELEPNDTVMLAPGEICPADGIIVEGQAWLDFRSLTGEPTPLPRGKGKRVLAGCSVIDGSLQVRVEKLAEDTQYAQGVTLAEDAPLQQTHISKYAKEVGQTLILPTLALSGGIFLLTANLERALTPLQLDLLTGINLSAPTTILSAMKRAKRAGIYVYSGRVLETLLEVDTVIFARTGTLTQETLTVVTIHSFREKEMFSSQEEATKELLSLAASAEQCEQGWQHPVARAIINHARELGVPIYTNKACHRRTGYGMAVSAEVNGRTIVVGTCNYLKQEGVEFPDTIEKIPVVHDGQHRGYWYVYVAADGQLLGQIICRAEVRSQSREVVTRLRQRGLDVHMVTGGGREMAEGIATQVNIPLEAVHAELTPEDKKSLVLRLQAEGRTVVYMGEGMDDYPALRYANVAVGTHQSCSLIQETANLRLPYGDLISLLVVFDLAEEAIKIIRQNITLIVIPNISATLLGILLILDPIWVVILNNTANLLAELNALRPLLKKNQ
jgi:Cu2+-exporting ATPase